MSGIQNAPQSLAEALQRIVLFFAIIPGGYALQLFQKLRPLAFRVGVCLTSAGQIHKICFCQYCVFSVPVEGRIYVSSPAGRFLQKKERRSVPE
jgi:hypothetical protein